MCGLFGSINLNLDSSKISNILHQIKHRGPDANGVFTEQVEKKIINLGHTRLEILDLKMGSQPMISKDKRYVVLFNGEIYNFMELRKKLEGRNHKFETINSDTEILIHGYKEWGENLPNYLNGMWSFAIYDNLKKNIFFSRDRFGEKPLFYYYKDKIFVFSSELAPITNFKELDLSLNYLNLKKYCAHGYFPGKLTPFKHINKLEAGSNLLLDIDSMQITNKKYWDYLIEPEYKTSENEWIDKIYNLLDKSVKNRLVADVPVGVFLSGGLDSSIISYFSQKHYPEKINTFSIKFEDSSFDETEYAQFISNKINSNHYSETIKSKDINKILNEFFEKFDEPLSDSSLLPYYLLCKFTSKKMKVVLGGDASDELFGGYDTFKAVKYANLMTKLKINKLHPAINYLISKFSSNYNYMSLKFKLERFFRFKSDSLSTSNCEWLSPLDSKELSELFGEETKNEELFSEAIELWETSNNKNVLDRSFEFYAKIFLQNQPLVKTDRLSMMHSLEVRTPFLDYELIDCIRKIPSKFKVNKNTTKYILKKTFEKEFGKKFTYRKKVGLSAPFSKWVVNKDIDLNFKSDFFKKKNELIDKKIQEHCSYIRENRIYLWNLLNLDNFLYKNGH